MKNFKSIIVTTAAVMSLMACSNEQDLLMSSYWIEDTDYSAEILKFTETEMINLNKDAHIQYTMEEGKLLCTDPEEGATITVNIVELTDQVLKINIGKNTMTYHPASDRDLFVGDWKCREIDSRIDFNNDGDADFYKDWESESGNWSFADGKLTIESNGEKQVVSAVMADDKMSFETTSDDGEKRTWRRD